jgi:hypothetical protein
VIAYRVIMIHRSLSLPLLLRFALLASSPLACASFEPYNPTHWPPTLRGRLDEKRYEIARAAVVRRAGAVDPLQFHQTQTRRTL